MREFDAAKWITSSVAALGVNYYRNGFAAVFLGGCIANSVAAKLLKRTFNQPRPATAEMQGLPDPGMPSSHAHMLLFLATYVGLALPGQSGGARWASPAAAGSLAVAVGSCVHRVRTGKHTVAQVVAGAVTGTAGGLMWRVACGDGAAARVEAALGVFRNSPRAGLEWPLLLACEGLGVFFLTGGGRRLSMRRPKAK
jgi:membrane-associated phospholipid phosphatase